MCTNGPGQRRHAPAALLRATVPRDFGSTARFRCVLNENEPGATIHLVGRALERFVRPSILALSFSLNGACTRRLLPLLLLLSVTQPPGVRAQGISVSPNCGTTSTHFILASGGWPTCSCNPCTGSFEVFVDGASVSTVTHPAGLCPSGFSLDMQDITVGGGCFMCTLLPGEHTVAVRGISECGAPASCLKDGCVQTTFQIVTLNGDPWAIDLQIVTTSAGLDSVVVTSIQALRAECRTARPSTSSSPSA